MTTTSAQTTHLSAEIAREHEADFVKALASADTAFAQYIAENNFYGASEALCSRVLTLRHCAHQAGLSPDQKMAFLMQAHHTAQAARDIVIKHTLSSAIAYQNLGKVQSELGLQDEATHSFEMAVREQEVNPHETQDRPGVLANMKEILASAQLSQGDMSALQRAELALVELEASDEDDYNKAVWLLHGHARIARACKSSNRSAAVEHYNKAKNILSSRTDLTLSHDVLDDLNDLAE